MKNTFINQLFNSTKIILAIFLTTLSYSNTANAVRNYQNHGTVCQPANLNQALAFGLSWSQLGTTNFNAIGSGKSFFVVCPITGGHDPDNYTNEHDIYLFVEFLDPAAGTVTCTMINTEINTVDSTVEGNGSDGIVATAIANFATTKTLIADSTLSSPTEPILYSRGNVDLFDNDFNGYRDNLVAVCALPPQTRIRGLNIQHD